MALPFKDILQGKVANMPDVRIDTTRVTRAARNAFAVVVNDIGKEFKAEISAPKWAWPDTTVRRNGSTVGSPRNIRDTDDLFNSQQMTLAGFAADFVWDVEYSGIVHQGNGAKVPPRPWTETALQSKAWATILENKWVDFL
jgi:hypothetical protein